MEVVRKQHPGIDPERPIPSRHLDRLPKPPPWLLIRQKPPPPIGHHRKEIGPATNHRPPIPRHASPGGHVVRAHANVPTLLGYRARPERHAAEAHTDLARLTRTENDANNRRTAQGFDGKGAITDGPEPNNGPHGKPVRTAAPLQYDYRSIERAVVVSVGDAEIQRDRIRPEVPVAEVEQKKLVGMTSRRCRRRRCN